METVPSDIVAFIIAMVLLFVGRRYQWLPKIVSGILTAVDFAKSAGWLLLWKAKEKPLETPAEAGPVVVREEIVPEEEAPK